jgi:hypothetical protein
MQRRPVCVQTTFLTIEDERAQCVELAAEFLREGEWRQEQSYLAIARWVALPKPPRAPWLGQQIRISSAATTVLQRANAMRRKLRLTPARIIWGWQ